LVSFFDEISIGGIIIGRTVAANREDVPMPAVTQRTIVRHFHALAVAVDAESKSDAQLLQAFAEVHDEAMFALLLKRHAAMVWGVCWRVLQHYQDAEDAFQATFLLLARHAGAVRNRQAVGPWLHHTAYRMALAMRRARLRRRRRDAVAPTKSSAEPGTDLAWREVQALLEEEIQRLPDKYRTAFVLCHVQSRGRAEAADLLGVREGTVSSRLDQARKRLQARLARRGVCLGTALAAVVVMEQAPLGRVCAATTKAAARIAAARSAAEVTIPQVAALVEQGTRMLCVGHRTIVAAVLAAALAVLGGGAVACQWHGNGQVAEEPPAPEAIAAMQAPADADKPHVDINGEPLPDGALVRFGTLRFRPGGMITNLVYTSGSKELVAQCCQGFAVVFDAATGRTNRRFPTAAAQDRCAVSADGRWLVVPVSKDPDKRGSDFNAHIELWDLADGTKVRSFGKAYYMGACFAPDGKTIAACRRDEVVEIWDPHSGTLLRSLNSESKKPKQDPYLTATFAPDGRTLLTHNNRHGAVRCWDVATGELRREFGNLPVGRLYAVSSKGVLALDSGAARGQEESDVEPTECRIRLVDLASGKDLGEMSAPLLPSPRPLPRFFSRGEFSPDGKWLVTARGTEGLLQLWDMSTRKLVRTWQHFTTGYAAMCFSPDGKQLAVAESGTAVRILDVATGEEAAAQPGSYAGALQAMLTADGKTLLMLDRGRTLHVWDAATGRLRERRTWPREHITQPVLTDDRATIVSWGMDANVRSWDIATRKERHCWKDNLGGAYYRGLIPSPDGKLLVLRHHRQLPLVVADAATGKPIHRLDTELLRPNGASFSADGHLLVTWGGYARPRVWDMRSGKLLLEIPYNEVPPLPSPSEVERDYLYDAALSRDARLIAFASNNRYIAIHELSSGREIRHLENLPDRAGSIAFSPDGRTLAHSGGSSVRLLDVATGKDRHQLTGHVGGAGAGVLCFSDNGRRLVTAGNDTTALLWDLGARPTAGSEADRLAAWNDLAGADAERAYRAVRLLAASPDFIGTRVKPAPLPDPARVAGLIADLGSDDFTTRDRANSELARLGDAAMPACRKALARESILEKRRRLEALIDKQARGAWDFDPERLRTVRALEALELSRTGEARRILERLAASGVGTWLADEASAALRRLRN
jgi:RNA polymerase sigma factor (sigma-70 family)